MTVSVRLFSILRERAGRERVELQLPDGATVADALAELARLPSLGDVLARLPVQLAVNRDYASTEMRLAPDDELALIPPLSGGAGPVTGDEASAAAGGPDGARDSADKRSAAPRVHVAVNKRPLDLTALSATVADPRAGAIVTFQGVTREVSRLDYEAYTEMASERIALIARECAAAHELCAIAVEHRVGRVALSQPSVIVAVSAPHRGEAFAAARKAIDRIKAEAPIWKVEVDADGQARGVPGTPAPGALAPEAAVTPTTNAARRDSRG
ncbi:MAG TPA: molybdenum cofactor biosynthesis protein MoaE [Solirubrobacteraceae bacterium]|jgi:molybdopterin synthase catalytic subunit|nr:molybdenum cofactor biosynthesis protein MoaE [Solirubrobacteraceae bacterium]